MKTKYVADDGTEFADRDACERYEDQVDFIRIMVDTIKPKVAEYVGGGGGRLDKIHNHRNV